MTSLLGFTAFVTHDAIYLQCFMAWGGDQVVIGYCLN